MVSRRALLALLGIAGTGTAGAASLLPTGPIDGWTPRPNTWPLPSYDLATTAANPQASPPDDPVVDWRSTGLGVGSPGIAVGPERVFVGGDGLAAIHRSDGTDAWRRGVAAGPIALRGGTIYTAARDGPGTVRAVDAADGEDDWTADGVREASSLLAADGRVLVGGEGGLGSHNQRGGARRWTSRTGGAAVRRPLVVDGSLYVAGDTLRRLQPRTHLEVALGWVPGRVWETEVQGRVRRVAASDSRLLVGAFAPRAAVAVAAVTCHDRSDGSVLWTYPASPSVGGAAAGGLAVHDGACFVGLTATGGESGDSDGGADSAGSGGGDADSGAGAVHRVRLSDGQATWQQPVPGTVLDLAVAGDAVVVATTADTVLALDAASGRERWSVQVVEAEGIAAVADEVFVRTGRGAVARLVD